MISLINRAISLVDNKFFESIALLFTRIALGGIFFRSARTKVEEGSLLDVSDTTIFLFQEEYGMPWPEVTGVIATYAEHALPILLFIGLGTRFAAAGLLVMTMVIQLFVYNTADHWWITHIVWAAMALVLIARGGGYFALDRLFDKSFASKS